MARPARPTLRCLFEDLSDGFDDPATRAAVASRKIPSVEDLSNVAHPLIRNVAQVFDGNPESERVRENIGGLTNPKWWKAKSGRWRGAVWEDPDTGQCWLCAAGLRREGETVDFYAAFMREVGATGENAATFLPTKDDRDRLSLELARERRRKWERDVFLTALTTVAAACDEGEVREAPLPHLREGAPSPATLQVEVERLSSGGVTEAHEEPAEVRVELRIEDFSDPEVLGVLLVTSSRAVSPHEESWDVVPVPGLHVLTATITEARVRQILVASTLPDEEVEDPGRTEPITHAHYARKNDIARGTIEGEAVVALCGVCFVPRQDYVGLPICSVCEDAYRSVTGA